MGIGHVYSYTVHYTVNNNNFNVFMGTIVTIMSDTHAASNIVKSSFVFPISRIMS